MKKKIDFTEFITKDYFENTLMKFLNAFRNEITFAIDGAVGKISEEIHATSNKNLTKLDSIVKELEEIREDRVLSTHQTRELRGEIDDQAKRITR